MKMQQLDLFASMRERFVFTKKIRLIECFGGIGAQSRAMEALGLDFEHHRLVEWAFPSIIGYNAIHQKDWKDYSAGMSVEDLLDKTEGISADYNKPMSREQRKRKGEAWLRRVYSAMVATKDFCPDISRVHASDLAITDTDKYDYLLTYSFPCQDLSLAGKGAGFQKGSGTRSGLLWEVERILMECGENKPRVLLMENVKQVLSDKDSWNSWLMSLESMGYTNYYKTINAKNYGIPQNRERTFMVSILGEYGYEFPEEFERKNNLKSFLDGKVDERYYLSDEMLKYIVSENGKYKVNKSNMKINQDPSKTVTTREGSTRADASTYVSKDCGDNQLIDKNDDGLPTEVEGG